jgi:hypothetical protein
MANLKVGDAILTPLDPEHNNERISAFGHVSAVHDDGTVDAVVFNRNGEQVSTLERVPAYGSRDELEKGLLDDHAENVTKSQGVSHPLGDRDSNGRRQKARLEHVLPWHTAVYPVEQTTVEEQQADDEDQADEDQADEDPANEHAKHPVNDPAKQPANEHAKQPVKATGAHPANKRR